MINVTPVILCGGSGTRLWPLSRTGFPKQFLCLTGKNSLFQQAAQRLADLTSAELFIRNPIIITGDEHRFLASEQLREAGIGLGCAILEPEGRNTAPAVTIAAMAAIENGQDPVLVVSPADQTIGNYKEFNFSLDKAINEAARGTIVTLGVNPTRPETGFGYINISPSKELIKFVESFIEKPDKKTAEKYLINGNYYWNAGIFVLKASVWLSAIEQFRPDIATATRLAWQNRTIDGLFIRPGKSEFLAIPNESVDFAVMERCPNSGIPIKMIPLEASWSDLGSWGALWDAMPKDNFGNSYTGDVLSTDSRNTLVFANSRLVSLVGVENLIIIETPDAVLVADKSQSQKVKHIVDELSSQRREEHKLHRKIYRPWGWYDSIEEEGRFKVKRIQVNPKASLSLQKHLYRAEHWIVVKGTAEITVGNTVKILTENQSTFIPIGELHRLANASEEILEIIEVQSGDYLGEDDIVRIDDKYGRT